MQGAQPITFKADEAMTHKWVHLTKEKGFTLESKYV